MINFLISAAVFISTLLGIDYFTNVNIWISSIIAAVAFAAVYLIITRIVMKKVGVLMEQAQREVQAGHVEKAVQTLESGFPLANWQYYLKPQLTSQIGTFYYLKKDFNKAFENLQKPFVRHWVAVAMLAICYMKKNKPGMMIETFNKGVSASKKEPLLWNLYAYCLENIGEHSKAMDILKKGIKKTGGDERLEDSLAALENGKKMKMLAYGDIWYQFHLEKTGSIIKKQQKAIQGRRKMVRR